MQIYVDIQWMSRSSSAFVTVFRRRNVVVSILLHFSWLIFFFLLLLGLSLLLLFLLDFLSPCYFLRLFYLLRSQGSEGLLFVVLVFFIFPFLVLRHLINIVQNIKMSRSFRQIVQPRLIPGEENSLTHRRNGSVQSRNFGQLMELGKKYYHENQMSQAVDILQRGMYYDSANLQLNYFLGVAKLSLQRFPEALSHFQWVVKRDKSFKKNLLLLLAIVYKKMGQMQSALESVSQQIQLFSTIQALLYRGRIYLQLGKNSQAKQDFNKILEKRPKNATVLILKARCLIAEGNLQQALQVIKLGRIVVDLVEHRLSLEIEEVRAYLSHKNLDLALRKCGEIQRQFPSVPAELHLLRAKIYQQSNRVQQSLMVYNQILSRNSVPKVFSEAIAESAIICMRERDFYESFAYLNRSQMMGVRSKVTDQLMRLSEGITFLMKKKYGQGILLIGSCALDFRHSLAGHLSFLKNLMNNAMAYGHFCLGNHDIALQMYRKIGGGEPSTDTTASSYNICVCQGILKCQQGQKEEAHLLFEKATKFINRPEPYFYMAVMLNEDYLKQPINTEGFVKVLELIEKGLRTGENAHMYYYRAILYLYLGMNGEALDDIDRAIQKSEDNVARYFHARGVIFFLDKNYQQALMEFGTALSISESDQWSIVQKAKCELLSGDSQSAYSTIATTQKWQEWTILFLLHEKQYSAVLERQSQEGVRQVCQFMLGKFGQAGPAGKLLLAILYQNYIEVVSLVEQAISLGVPIGCLQANDLLILKAFCEYRLDNYEGCLLSLSRVESYLRQTSGRSQTYSQEDQRKLLMCRVNTVLVNFRRGHQLEATGLMEELIGEVCEGAVFDELDKLRVFLIEGGQYSFQLGLSLPMLSDYFTFQNFNGLQFKFLIPMPNYRVSEVEYPQYQQLLIGFGLKDIDNRPEAPWIRRGQFGLIFTNEMREYENLNLKTEQNQAVRSRLPTIQQSREVVLKRSQLAEQLKLSATVLERLNRLTQKGNAV